MPDSCHGMSVFKFGDNVVYNWEALKKDVKCVFTSKTYVGMAGEEDSTELEIEFVLNEFRNT